MLGGLLHLFIAGSGVRGRYGNPAPYAFFDQPQVLIKFRRQRKQANHAGVEKFQRAAQLIAAQVVEFAYRGLGGRDDFKEGHTE